MEYAVFNRISSGLLLVIAMVLIEVFKWHLGNVRQIESLALSSSLQGQIVEAAPNGMLMVSPDGAITLLNAHVEQLFGYRREELLGQPIGLLIPDRFRPQHPDLRNAFFRTPTTRAMGMGRDLYGRRKDGSEFPVELGLNPIQTSSKLQVLDSIIDITARKQTEKTLRESEERYRLMVEEVFIYDASNPRRDVTRSCSSSNAACTRMNSA